MAIVINGSSVCKICSNVILENEEVVGLPAFTGNMLDPIYFFNDAAFHKRCLPNHACGDLALDILKLWSVKINPKNRVCVVTNKPITEQGDYFFTGLLTSNAEEKLYNYNFITVNKKFAKLWINKEDFLVLFSNYVDEGKWKDSLNYDFSKTMISIFK